MSEELLNEVCLVFITPVSKGSEMKISSFCHQWLHAKFITLDIGTT